MTGIDGPGAAIGSSPAGRLPGPLRPYADIFRIPGAWRFSAAGVIGRMPMSMFGLGTVLLISAATGKYGVAGAVSAAGSLGYAFSSPQIARLVDARGQRRVLLPLLAVFTVATAALIAAVEAGLPPWAWFVPGAIAGAAMPSLGTMVRARWSVLLAGSPRLHAAFSFESVADELCFVIGPAAVTLLATEVFPAAGVGVAALLCLAGTLWFVGPAPDRAGLVRADRRPAGPAAVRADRRRPASPAGLAGPPGRGRAGPGRAGSGVPAARRDVRVDRPEHGLVRPALRAQAAGRAHPRHVRPRQRDGRAVVRVQAVAGADREPGSP